MAEAWLPAAGPVSLPCERCRVTGHLRLDHVMEWADPPPGGWPPGVDAARIIGGCRACGSGFLDLTRRLAMSPAGEMASVPWVRCEMCDREEAGQRWAWLRCGACRAEFRAVVGGGA